MIAVAHTPVIDLLRHSLDAAAQSAEVLVATPARSDLLELAAGLPPCFTRGGLEVRLAEAGGVVDLGLCLERVDAPAFLAGAFDGGGCIGLIRRWSSSTSGPWPRIPRAWLEIDRPPAVGDQFRSVPWMGAFPFFSVEQAVHADDGFRILDGLFDGELADVNAGGLPRDARVKHIASLEHRGEREWRVQAVARNADVRAWVERQLGFDSEPADVLRAIVEDLPIALLAVQAYSHGGSLRPLSVEIAFPHGGYGDSVWRELLQRLVDRGLASGERCAALTGWPGASTHDIEEMPALVRIDRMFHVTLRLVPSSIAKAYLYFYPQYVLQ